MADKYVIPWWLCWVVLISAAILVFIVSKMMPTFTNNAYTAFVSGMNNYSQNNQAQAQTNTTQSKPTSPFGKLVMENECRSILENMFQRPFTKIRPAFLKYPLTKRNLELDGYNADLKIGFEYQGPQHRVYLPMYHSKGIEDFHKQLARDQWKADRCKELGITLIVIPDTVPRDDMARHIAQELEYADMLQY